MTKAPLVAQNPNWTSLSCELTNSDIKNIPLIFEAAAGYLMIGNSVYQGEPIR